MSLLTDLRRKWRVRRMTSFIKESKKLSKDLIPIGKAEQTRKKAVNFTHPQDDSISWNDRLWLLDTRERAQGQILLLDTCLVEIDRVLKLNPEREALAEFVKIFSHLVDEDERKVDGINDLKTALNALRNVWSEVVRTISVVKTHMWAMQTFLRFSELSRLEIGSLIIGALIVLGAVRMVFFYQAAAAQSVSAYWTLDDLIIEGITIAPLVVVVLLFFELLFRVFGTYLVPKTLKNPTKMVLFLFGALLVFTSCFGYFRGKAVFVEFRETEGDEVATVMDNTILRNVHLVGTTSRTAVFLKATQGKSSLQNSKRKNYWNTICCVADEFRIGLPFFDLPWTQCQKPDGDQPYQVLVMDRAQVVCHARGNMANICTDLPIRKGAVVRQEDLNTLLNDNFRTAQKGLADKGTKALNDRIDVLEEHIDRHYSKITARLSLLAPDSD